MKKHLKKIRNYELLTNDDPLWLVVAYDGEEYVGVFSTLEVAEEYIKNLIKTLDDINNVV